MINKILLLLFVGVSSACASQITVPATSAGMPGYAGMNLVTTGFGDWKTTKSDACNDSAQITGVTEYHWSGWAGAMVGDLACQVTARRISDTWFGVFGVANLNVAPNLFCKSGYSKVGAVCTLTDSGSAVPNSTCSGTMTSCDCIAEYVPNGGGTACDQKDCGADKAKDANYGSLVQGHSVDLPDMLCIDGCAYRSGGGIGLEEADPPIWEVYVGTSMGSVCSAQSNPSPVPGVGVPGAPPSLSPETEAPPCQAGDVRITYVFGFVCASPESLASGIPPDLSKSSRTPGGLIGAGDVVASTSTSTTTTNADGSTTTTTSGYTTGGGSSSGSSGPMTIDFPTDYAKSSDVTALGGKLDTLHGDLSQTANANEVADIDSSTMPTFGTTFDSLRAFQIPAHASGCPAPSIDLSGVLGAGRIYQFNAHCALVQNHFGALQAAMMACWSVAALFVVLRA